MSNTLTLLFFAFIGGLLLNLMPCVFPVLSIKVLSLVKTAAKDRQEIRLNTAGFTIGVLTSFWTLFGIILLFQMSGKRLGWGFQLQEPVFVALMALLFLFLALNLLGVFEITLGIIGLNQTNAKNRGFIPATFNGILATVVATPCTAPFMGTALGVALTKPSILSFFIFTFLGLGMAAPYVLLSFFPAFLSRLPKPGPWMVIVKRCLAIPMIATVFWLVWILEQEVGPTAVFFFNLYLGIFGAGLWCWGQSQNELGKTKNNWQLAAICLVMVSVIFCIKAALTDAPIHVPATPQETNLHTIPWEDYNAGRLKGYLAKGNPVFLKFTAAWCISCKVNEKLSFNSKRVRDKFSELKIIPIEVDWTHRSQEISDLLRTYGRNSIPFYVYYPSKKPQSPVFFPEILTADILLKKLAISAPSSVVK
ncbi:MAG: thiol:disulfide interchange protein [Candidatus Marinamargulisbacteria bacterium]|jgi:thiol:disulfide interchange protein